MERLDAVEAGLKELGGSAGEDNSGNADCEVDVAESSKEQQTAGVRMSLSLVLLSHAWQ